MTNEIGSVVFLCCRLQRDSGDDFFRIARIRRRKLFETPSGEVGRCHIRAVNT